MKISVDFSRIYAQLSDANMTRAQRILAEQALADMNQFVPMKEGSLRNAVSVDTDGKAINYHMPYARAQFYGFVGKGGFRVYNYTTPGTSRRWDLRAKAKYMDSWEKAYLKGMGF